MVLGLDSVEVTLVSLVLLVVLLVLRIKLYYVIATVFVVAALLYGGLEFLLVTAYRGITAPATLGLVLSVFAISVLVSLYIRSGIVFKLAEELSRLFKSNLLAITLVPGIIGLMPVPGGALMSAPIVDVVGSRMGLSTARKLFVNVWYRHVIVYVYPLSSVIIVTSAVTGVDLWLLVLAQIPVAIAMFLLGLPFVGVRGFTARGDGGASVGVVAKGMTPILSSIILAVLLSPIDQVVGVERFSVTLAVLISIAVFLLLNNQRFSLIVDSLRDARVWEITVISAEVMVFRELFLSMDLKPIATAMLNSSVDVNLLILALPIIFSLAAGHPTAGVAIASPIVASIAGMNLPIATLVYASAFIGYIASPLHLCYIYTAQYYNISMVEGYKYMIPATVASLAVAFIVATYVIPRL